MDKKTALTRFEQYLKHHQICYFLDQEDQTDQITMRYTSGCSNCPDGILESCLRFYHDSIEARVYYDANAAKWVKTHCENHSKLFRLFNFINADVWMKLSDGSGQGLYRPSYLYTPRLYVTEDGCYDISITTAIPLDFYELAPLETEDYITAYCTEIMDRLSVPIFGVLLGSLSVEEAIFCIKKNVLNEDDEEDNR